MAGGSRNIAVGAGGFGLFLALIAALLFGAEGTRASAQPVQASSRATFLGVATCSGSTCHGRSVPNVAPGPAASPDAPVGVVRQDEIVLWQDPASAAGAHSRAFAVLQGPRSRQIAQRLGIGEASSAPECLGCHSTPAPTAFRGARFLRSDGVSCESCHGAASTWLTQHYSAGANHPQNLANGMIPLENARARAEVCLSCHFGNREENRFVTHRIMAAGHPRISFELDLFSTLQAHHNDDEDYRARKPDRSTNVQMWAIGQAMALDRSLDLFTNSGHGRDGLYPEFYFFDCHSCHRQIRDDPNFDPTVVENRGRPIILGMPPYNDENMIMLSAAAHEVAGPRLSREFDEATAAFYRSMRGDENANGDMGRVRAAAIRLRAKAAELAEVFASRPISRELVFAMINRIASTAVSERFTDYAGSVQAVMATDTLLSALVSGYGVSAGAVQGIRGDINLAYQAVREPNVYNPGNFRASLGRAAAAIRRLR